jgi:anti-sigma B factor antagonist
MDELQEFGISTDRLAGTAAIVCIAGDLDLYTAPEVEVAFATLPDGTRHVLVDLTALTFVDSAGISALLAAERRLRRPGGSLTLLVDDLRVLRVLEVTGLDRFLSIHQDRETAVRQVTEAALAETLEPAS